jgi:hypothetical protein
LRLLREAVNYLGMESPASKLQVVRGHPFGFDIKTLTISKRLKFFEMLEFAGGSSTAIIAFILGEIEKHCQQEGWRGPKRGDDEWLNEYIQEDLLLNVLPDGPDRVEILKRGFSMVLAGE